MGRVLDWAATPLGPVQGWSQSLRSTVRTLLSSQYPMVLTWGEDFTQIYNDAYSKLIGDRHPSGFGGDIRITLAEAWATLGPMIARVMATGIANWTPALPLEMHRSGYREEAYFSVSHAPAEDDRGRIVGMLAVCSEVTDQIVGERRLRLLRELAARAGDAEETAQAASDLVAALAEDRFDVPFACLYLRDQDGHALAASQGLSSPETAADLDWRTGDAVGPSPLDRAMQGETSLVHAVDRLTTARGGAFDDPVETAICLPIVGAHGAVLGTLVAGISPNRALDDVYRSFFELLATQVSVAVRNARAREDERRRAADLAELDRAKTTFFSNVSHEFRTPLTLLLGPLERAVSDLPERLPDHRDELDIAYRNGLRLLRLVNTLLDFSRVEAKRVEAHLVACDLAWLTADLASIFRSAIERAGLELRVETEPLPQPVLVDPDMYEKIVLNLLSNAFKFTLAGTITVRLEDLGGAAVSLSVEDTGVGIPAAERDRVFERFHRVEAQGARSHEGSGIGLALVKQLVELHAGTISAESEGPGRGTRFTVILPYGSATPAQDGNGEDAPRAARSQSRAFVEEAFRWLPDAEDADVAEPRSGDRRRVLVVDDNRDMRAYIQRLLRNQYSVSLAANGEEALSTIGTFRPDLVLCDIMMPKMDGFSLLRHLRTQDATAALPIIFLSARAGEEARVESLNAGADDHIVKPFGSQELLARIDGALRLAALRGEAAARQRILEAELAAEQAASALARSEQHLQTLTDALPVLIAHVGKDLRYRFVNHTYETWFGQDRSAVIGRPVIDVVGETAFAKIRPRLDAVLAGERLCFEDMVHYPGLGTRHVRADYIPERGADGQVEGFYGLVQDVTEVQSQARRLADSERRMRTVLDAVSDGFFAVNVEGQVTLFNRAAEEALGLSREAVLGQPLAHVVPELLQPPYDAFVEAAMTQRVTCVFELTDFPHIDQVIEVRLAPKEGGGIAASFSDITERKLSERHRELLVNELNHRVKNTLAVVQSIAIQSFKDDRVPAEAKTAFQGRLLALSQAHNLLTRESWESAPLRQVIENAVQPFGGPGRFLLQGPNLRVGPKAAVSLSLAFHELCTNAAKYGALQGAEGRVRISWFKEGGHEPTFRLIWTEEGGPPVTVPNRTGFGSRLVERGLAAELRGTVALQYRADGVVCEITTPLASIQGR
ncbi:PAS domain-containing protein [Rhizobium sp. Leaf371]|uniref:PAS domain-containing protein n=1 Tax=Rhizobium sp. Leaf371 TaxID=1736355 RepID=UPI0012E78F71|nr:PAS domain-containing protein [Rhizobium sp. Leaf371]